MVSLQRINRAGLASAGEIPNVISYRAPASLHYADARRSNERIEIPIVDPANVNHKATKTNSFTPPTSLPMQM